MVDSTLTRDNLFQLNILVWASFPHPIDAPVTPVLRNAGYILWSIERPLNAGVAELARLRKTTEIQPNPVVDAVFEHARTNTYVLVECKPSSFGVNSEWAPQARGMIVAGGNAASRLGLSVGAVAELCYLVPADDAQATDTTLATLAAEVSGQRFVACPTGSLGLSIKADGAYLGLLSQPRGVAQMPQMLIPEQRVIAVRANQDPRPLYIIPWIPDVVDDTALEAFKEKLRAQLLSWLGKASIGGQVTLQFEDLLYEVSRGIFRIWRDRDSLHGRVFPIVASIVNSSFGGDGRVGIGTRAVVANLNSEKDREDLMEQVRTAGLPEKLPEVLQLRMEEQP